MRSVLSHELLIFSPRFILADNRAAALRLIDNCQMIGFMFL